MRSWAIDGFASVAAIIVIQAPTSRSKMMAQISEILEMSDKLTELEVALLKHMEFIIHDDHRPISFLDLMHFEVEGKEYTMSHGTCRNKLSKLRKEGVVEFSYNSGIAFYTLKGIHLEKKAANPMTPNHIGVLPQQVPQQVHLLQHIKRIPNIKKHPLYKCIKHHPFDKAAVHDLHLKFIAAGLWSILNNNSMNCSHVDGNSSGSGSGSDSSLCVLQTDPYSKDIRLEKRLINGLDILVTVHHTDTVTVVIGCSFAPIVVDEYGVIRLSEALATIEEELSVLIERCHDDGSGSCNSDIDIPNHMSWIVTRWDFGVDGLITYTGKHFFFSWGSSQNVLVVFYIKKWSQNDYRIRVECRESPNMPLGKALKEKMIRRKGS